MGKCDNIEKDSRITQVIDWIVNGYSNRDIIKKCEKAFGIKQTESYTYLKHARKYILEEYTALTRDDFIADAREKLDNQYLKANSVGDGRLCKDILLAKNKILGYEQLKIEHDVNGELLKEFSRMFFKNDSD